MEAEAGVLLYFGDTSYQLEDQLLVGMKEWEFGNKLTLWKL